MAATAAAAFTCVDIANVCGISGLQTKIYIQTPTYKCLQVDSDLFMTHFFRHVCEFGCHLSRNLMLKN